MTESPYVQGLLPAGLKSAPTTDGMCSKLPPASGNALILTVVPWNAPPVALTDDVDARARPAGLYQLDEESSARATYAPPSRLAVGPGGMPFALGRSTLGGGITAAMLWAWAEPGISANATARDAANGNDNGFNLRKYLGTGT